MSRGHFGGLVVHHVEEKCGTPVFCDRRAHQELFTHTRDHHVIDAAIAAWKDTAEWGDTYHESVLLCVWDFGS